MDRIIITEQDLATNNITEEQIVDVVFVPGFASGVDATDPVGAYIPTFCSSIAEFEAHFGTTPAKFAQDQFYPKYSKTAKTEGFPSDAIPPNLTGQSEENVLWFSAGAYDPSYIYAKELLYAGLPVMYYRVNEYQKSDEAEYDVKIEHLYKVFREKLFNSDSELYDNLN